MTEHQGITDEEWGKGSIGGQYSNLSFIIDHLSGENGGYGETGKWGEGETEKRGKGGAYYESSPKARFEDAQKSVGLHILLCIFLPMTSKLSN